MSLGRRSLGWKQTLAGGVLALGLVGAACSNYGGTIGITPSAAPVSHVSSPTTAPSSPPATTAPSTTAGVTCPSSAGKVTVVQQNFAFAPAKLSAKACTTVRITNKDSTTTHTFTIDGSPINVTLPGGTQNSAELVLAPGTYVYYCRFHGSPNGTGMAGKLTVT